MAVRTDHDIRYSPREERFNRWSHALAALAAGAGAIWLIALAARTGDPYRLFGSIVFGGSLITFYLVSTTYHSVQSKVRRALFRKLDHVGIYVLIAGTYTPITLVTMRDGNGWTIFAAVWSLALVGILFKVFTVHRIPFLGPTLYIALGWLIVVDLEGLIEAMPPPGLKLLVAGGVIYTVGIIFFAVNRIPHHHGIWHLFVAGGSLCHYLAILWYVIPLHP